MDLAPGQDDPCHPLECDENGCQVNEQEQREARLTEKGMRAALLTTKHFKYLPRGAFKISTPKCALPQQQGTAPSPSAQQGRAGTDAEPAWAQVTPGPVSVPPRAMALPELPHEQDVTPVRSREPVQARQVRPLPLNTTPHTAAQQGKGTRPPEPSSSHSTSASLVSSWFAENKSCPSHNHQ